MTTIVIHRGVVEGQPPPQAVTIILGDSIIEVAKDANPMALARIINFEADSIAEALIEHLPQATGNRLLAKLHHHYRGQPL